MCVWSGDWTRAGLSEFVFEDFFDLLNVPPVLKSFDYALILKSDSGVNVTDSAEAEELVFGHRFFVCAGVRRSTAITITTPAPLSTSFYNKSHLFSQSFIPQGLASTIFFSLLPQLPVTGAR